MSGVVRKDLSWSPGSIGQYGKRVAIVGGTGGIGQALARLLASQGAKVTVVGQTFRDQGTPNLEFLKADLSSMKEAARVARTLKHENPDLWLLTMGIYAAPQREVTSEGLERDMAVSFWSRLAMLRELAPDFSTPPAAGAARPRVFIWGFPGAGNLGNLDDLNAEQSYGANVVHFTTVAGNEALVHWAAKKFPGAAFFGINPGLIKTNIRANILGGNASLKFKLVEGLISLFTPTAEQYAKKTLPLLLSPELEQHSGALFNAKAKPILRTEGMDDARVEALISRSEPFIERAQKT